MTLEMAVAPIALALANHPDLEAYDLSSLRYIMWGATPVTESVAAAVTARTGVRFLPAYGASELPVLATNPVAEPDRWRLDSAGLPPHGVEIRVVDLVSGARCRPARWARSRPARCRPWPATCRRRRRPRPSPTAGTAPATSAGSSPRAGSTSPTGRRSSSRSRASRSHRPRSRPSSTATRRCSTAPCSACPTPPPGRCPSPPFGSTRTGRSTRRSCAPWWQPAWRRTSASAASWCWRRSPAAVGQGAAPPPARRLARHPRRPRSHLTHRDPLRDCPPGRTQERER